MRCLQCYASPAFLNRHFLVPVNVDFTQTSRHVDVAGESNVAQTEIHVDLKPQKFGGPGAAAAAAATSAAARNAGNLSATHSNEVTELDMLVSRPLALVLQSVVSLR